MACVHSMSNSTPSSDTDNMSDFLNQLSPIGADCLSPPRTATALSPKAAPVADGERARKAICYTARVHGVGIRPHRPKREKHTLLEKRRRDRIKTKLKALQELIPNSYRLDRASVLDSAIQYIKFLQQQLEIFSGGGSYQGSVISPAAVQLMQTPNLGMGIANMAGSMQPPFPSSSSPSLPHWGGADRYFRFPLFAPYLSFTSSPHISTTSTLITPAISNQVMQHMPAVSFTSQAETGSHEIHIRNYCR